MFISKRFNDNFKIAAFLFYEVYGKKSYFWTFFTNLLKNKKSSDLKIITNRFEIKFCLGKFLQILIPTKNLFFLNVILKNEKK
jgi:hypothetical protein